MAEHPKETPAEHDEHKGASGHPEADSAKVLEKAAAEEKAAAQNVLEKAKAEKEHKKDEHEKHDEQKEGGHARRKESGGSLWDRSYNAVRSRIFKTLTVGTMIALPPIGLTAYLTKKAMDNTLGRVSGVKTAYNKTKELISIPVNKAADIVAGTITFPVSAVDRVEDVYEALIESKKEVESKGIIGRTMEHLTHGLLYVPSKVVQLGKAGGLKLGELLKWCWDTGFAFGKKTGESFVKHPVLTTLTVAGVIGGIASYGGPIAASEALFKLGYGFIENLAILAKNAAIWLAK